MPRPITLRGASPLVREFFEILRQSPETSHSVCDKAGLGYTTVNNWAHSRSPSLPNFEAALNVLGYHLKIERIENASDHSN